MKAINIFKINSILFLFALLGIILQFGLIESRNLQENDEWDFIFKIMFKCDESKKGEFPLNLFSVNFWNEMLPLKENTGNNNVDKMEIIYERGEVLTIDIDSETNITSLKEKSMFKCISPETYVDFKIKGNTTSLYSLFENTNFNLIYAEKIKPQKINIGRLFAGNNDLEFVFFKNLNAEVTKAEYMFANSSAKLVDLSNIKVNLADIKTDPNWAQNFFGFLETDSPISLDFSSIDFKKDFDYTSLPGYDPSSESISFDFYHDEAGNPNRSPALNIKSKDYNPNDPGEIYSANPNASYAEYYLFPNGKTNDNECPNEYPVLYDNRFCIKKPYFFLPESELKSKNGKNLNFSYYSRPCLYSKIEAEYCGLCELKDLDKCVECKFGYTFENNGNCTFRGIKCDSKVDNNCLYCKEDNDTICSYCKEGFTLNDDENICKDDNRKDYRTSFIVFLALFIIVFICAIVLAIIIYIKMHETTNDIKYDTKDEKPKSPLQESVSENNIAPSNNA